MTPLLAFYYGSHPVARGRRLAEILRQDDAWLESSHDFIQWLFPLAEPSRVTPDAPLVDSATARTFRADPLLQQHLRGAFVRMLAFYGLCFDGRAVRTAANWEARKADWFVAPTHNNLRITRILKSLRLLGLQPEAEAFHRALRSLCAESPDAGVGSEALRHWDAAMRE